MGQRTQIEKGQAFRALHQRDGAFIIPNPWDIGSARILSHLGFEALATGLRDWPGGDDRACFGAGFRY
jgi:2-methylisocitrate lyase-like PEP mutase family enzyme